MKKLLTMAFATAVAVANAATLFSDNFDSYANNQLIDPLPNWSTIMFGSAPYKVSNVRSTSASNSMFYDMVTTPDAPNEIVGGWAWGSYSYTVAGNPEPLVVSTTKFFIPNAPNAGTGAIMGVDGYSTADRSAIGFIQLDSDPLYDGVIVVSAQGNWSDTVGIAQVDLSTLYGQWHELTTVQDTSNLTFTVKYDGIPVSNGASAMNAASAVLTDSDIYVQNFQQSPGLSFFFDDHSVKSYAAKSVSGTIAFEGFVGSAYAGNIFFVQTKLYQGGVFKGAENGQVDVAGTIVDVFGAPGAIKYYGIADGTYDMLIDGWFCLNKKVSVTFSGGVATVNTVLKAGDSDDNGVVDLTDYTRVATAFNGRLDNDTITPGNQSDANWDASADFNGDGVVDLTDYTNVATNFNAVDDVP